jgi:CheY-like chemotaxis protein
MYDVYLRLGGFQVIQAANGDEGLAKAFAERPDVIVMDLAMPRLDGLEATRRLKADERTRHVPVVVLTGNGLDSHVLAHKAGCDAYLLKPCLPTDLAIVLESLIAGRADNPEAAG